MPVPSTVKVRQAIADAVAQLPELQNQAAGMQAIALSAIGPFVPGLVDNAVAMLPDDPAELDHLLEVGAGWMLSLRSDPQPEPPAIPEALDAATAGLGLGEAAA